MRVVALSMRSTRIPREHHAWLVASRRRSDRMLDVLVL